MKRVLAISLTLCISLLAGCSGGKKPVSSSGSSSEAGISAVISGISSAQISSTAASSKTNSAAASKASSTGGKVSVASTLKNPDVTIMWLQDRDQLKTSQNPDSVILNRAIKEFEAKYKGTVDVIPKSWDEFNTYLTTTVANGESPDVVIAHNGFYPNWAAKGLVQPLDSLININDPIYNKTCMNLYVWKGKHYGAFSGSPKHSLIVYNKDLFKANAVPTPMDYYNKHQWTWSNFLKVADALTTKDSSGNVQTYGFDGYGLFPGAMGVIPMVQITGNGSIQLNWTNSKFSESLQRFYDLYQNHPCANNGYDLWNENFPKGNVAMVASAFDEVARTKQANPKMSIGIAPFPLQPGQTKLAFPSQLTGWSISAKSGNPKGAAEFIKFIFNAQIELKKELGEYYSSTKYMTKDEISMLKSLDKENYYISAEGVGNLKSVVEGQFTDKIVLGKASMSYQQLYDTTTPLVKAAFNDFMSSVK